MRVLYRLLRASAAITGLLCVVAVGLAAQIPGQNVNIVSKDPYLQKQNEPSGAVGTLNPCHLLFGGNDYRTVNIPGDLGDKEVGDAWVGVYESTDCGQTWLAGLMPGYPQDTSPEGTASPAHGFAAAADPTVKAGLAGFYAYSHIVFNRGSNLGQLLLARFIDPNNAQVSAANVTSGDPLQVPIGKWPIQYVGPTLLVDGTSGQFLDKPHMTVSPGVGTCDLPYREPDPAAPGGFVTKTRTIPATVVHLVWTTFLNNATDGKTMTRVNYNRSSNCGSSLDGPTKKLSETYKVNQGASVAVSPTNPNIIFVAWRSFDLDTSNNQSFLNSQVLFAKSSDGGKSFTAPTPVPNLSPAPSNPPSNIFFDQNTSTDPPRFRTIAYATTTFDHTGKYYLAIAVRSANAQRSARIMYTTTLDGVTWTDLVPVADSAGPEHQIMPALTYASGKLQAIWYDFVDDASQVFKQDIHDGHVYDPTLPAGQHVRHTVDVRGAQGNFDASGNVTFSTYGVLQLPGLHPKISQYLLGNNVINGVVGPLQQLQSDRVNLKLYCGGGCPFIGDYIDVAGLQWVTQAGATPADPTTWAFNGPATAGAFSQDFHAAWTDNRDALIDSPVNGLDAKGAIVPYNAPGTGCDANLTKSRNANIYTSRMTPGLSLLLPVNAKPIDAAVPQRSFPIVIQNGTDATQTVTVAFANQPAGGQASFAQFSSVPSIVVDIPKHSSAARTIFVTSSAKFPRIQVLASAGPSLNASVVINPDPSNPGVFGSLKTGETHESGVANPDLDNPDLDNPDLDNPDLDNPDLDNVQVENPDLDNPDLDNPDLDNPDLDNPDLDNVSLVSGVASDTSYEITNTGNDASVYQIDLDITGKKTDPYYFQLFARRVYKLPSAKGCAPTNTGQNQVLFNISSPDTVEGDFLPANDKSAKNATVLLMPGETIKLTMRVRPKDAKTPRFCPFADADGLCTAKMKTNTVYVKVKSQGANTGQNTPKVVIFSKQ